MKLVFVILLELITCIVTTVRCEDNRGGRMCDGVPCWCPPGSPRIHCKANPCQVEQCPAFPNAVCINDNPCEPSCVGNFYLGRRKLTRQQCQGDEMCGIVPCWCPEGSPRIYCFVNPCQVEQCPAFPNAVCINDNPCEPACEGNFYLGRRKLTRQQCQGGVEHHEANPDHVV